jgi:hypothetical protein
MVGKSGERRLHERCYQPASWTLEPVDQGFEGDRYAALIEQFRPGLFLLPDGSSSGDASRTTGQDKASYNVPEELCCAG